MSKRRSEELRDAIEEMIAFGKLQPGERLDETVLAERFGVSRTPVREALNQLATAGMVEIRPRRGAVVAEIGPRRLVEMFEVMAELEGMCGRLAARRMTETEQQALLAAQEGCKAAMDANDPDDYYQRNDEFHGVIYAASHNDFLIEQTWILRRRMRAFRRLQLRVRGRIPIAFMEHEEIIAALVSGQGERTAELLKEHVTVQGKRFADLIASLPQTNRAA